MTNIEFQTKNLIREIKKNSDYKKYQTLKRKFKKNPKLMAQINAYRKEQFELQIDSDINQEVALAQLRQKYYDILCIADVHAFLTAEQRLCRILQKVMAAVSEAADLDIDFW